MVNDKCNIKTDIYQRQFARLFEGMKPGEMRIGPVMNIIRTSKKSESKVTECLIDAKR